MKSRDFCYWLQGHFELNEGDVQLSAKQVAHIRAHLNMVFIHEIDPSFPQHQQAALTAAHEGREIMPWDKPRIPGEAIPKC